MDRKRWAGATLTFAALALAGEWIVRGAGVLLSLFYHGGAIDWTAARAATGLTALPVGLYLLFQPGSKASAQNEIDRLCKLAKDLTFQIAAFKGDGRRGIRGEVASLYLGLKKLQFATPDPDLPDLELVLKRADHFIAAIFPMIRDGHVNDARQESAQIVQKVEQEVPTNFRRTVTVQP